MYKLLAIFACLSVASATVVLPCDDGSMMPTAVRIQGCDAVPCEATLGDTVRIEADGTATQVLDNLWITITSIRPDGTITEVPIPDNNGCNLIVDGSCPVAPGTDITLSSEVYVDPMFPPGETTLEVRTTMEGVTLTCFAAPVILHE